MTCEMLGALVDSGGLGREHWRVRLVRYRCA